MDLFDIAQEWEMKLREQQISQAAQGSAMPCIGVCYFCDQPLEKGHRFCDADCRDGWQAEQAARYRNGFPVDESPLS